MSRETLQRALSDFDGKHVAPLKRVAVQVRSEDVCAFITGPEEIGATWVLKAIAEDGRASEKDIELAFEALSELSESDAILHVLQIAQFAPNAARAHQASIRALLIHKKTLVRVWALDAMVRAAPGSDEARRLVEEALKGPQASLRARARALKALVYGTN
ncbi:MAG: hypothetical protein QNJ35_09785 [Paracoccaceae bacterium]|nr:hypothetical protein [Paracoccaceae bacterium]